MSLLIDGYNLMFAAGLNPQCTGPGVLQRARRGLLNYLVKHLSTDEIQQTVVVFDAKNAPSGVANEERYRGIHVLFATDHDEADDLIEQLIRHESVPRRLVVVTSDLRLRTAARRRRARSVKSEDWLDEVERRDDSPTRSSFAGKPRAAGPGKPSELAEEDVTKWLEAFGIESDSSESSDWGPFPPGYGEDLLDDADDET